MPIWISCESWQIAHPGLHPGVQTSDLACNSNQRQICVHFWPVLARDSRAIVCEYTVRLSLGEGTAVRIEPSRALGMTSEGPGPSRTPVVGLRVPGGRKDGRRLGPRHADLSKRTRPEDFGDNDEWDLGDRSDGCCCCCCWLRTMVMMKRCAKWMRVHTCACAWT